MKKALVFIAVGTAILSVLFIWVFMAPRPVSVLPTTIVPVETKPVQSIPDIIKRINGRNSLVRSLSAHDAVFKAYINNFSLNFKGSVFFEKDDNFRIYVRSIFGQELDIGSNVNTFWFWSKRMVPQGLYYAAVKDFEKTRLKSPYHPIWIKDCLGLSEINLDKCQVQELETKWIVIEQIKDGNGQPMKKVGFINKATERIEGYILYDRNGGIIATGEIQEYFNGLPRKIYYVWKEENIALVVDLVQPQSNVSIDPKYWIMPSIQPQIDMTKN